MLTRTAVQCRQMRSDASLNAWRGIASKCKFTCHPVAVLARSHGLVPQALDTQGSWKDHAADRRCCEDNFNLDSHSQKCSISKQMLQTLSLMLVSNAQQDSCTKGFLSIAHWALGISACFLGWSLQKQEARTALCQEPPAVDSKRESFVKAVAARGPGRVDELFVEYFSKGQAPGVAYGVVVDGKLLHVGGLGTLRVGEDAPPKADSIFRIASMSKSFVAAMVLLLRDEGVLSLEDAAEKWVPELKHVPLPSSDSQPPTLRHLLSMSAGLPEDDPWADRLESLSDDEYTALVSQPMTFNFAPGFGYDYSNLGFTLLGRVIQNATGRNFQEVISERIIAPLGMKDTAWSDDLLDKKRLAAGYALADDPGPRGIKEDASSSTERVWVAQPIQKTGAFAALGGLYSTIDDLAIWVSGFLDAWPPRDVEDNYTHPLSRSSRREMQQLVIAMPLQLGSGEGLQRAQLHGYCLGLKSQEDLVTGRIIGHSGGYPGFGSRMAWHPEARVGVIGLANGRYGGPYATVPDAVAAMVAALPRRLRIEPHPVVDTIRRTIDGALITGDFTAVEPLLSANVDMDMAIPRRAAAVASLAEIHGALAPVERMTVATPLKVGWWLEGDKGRVGVSIMLSPESPPKVQMLNIVSVKQPTAELEAIRTKALEDVNRGTTEFSSLLLPIRQTSWVACDGLRKGTVLIEGASICVRLRINLDAKPITKYEPDARPVLPA